MSNTSSLPANTWLGISEKIKEFFQNYVATGFYLQLQDTEDEPLMREPYVDLQCLPHKNFVPPDWIQPSSGKPYKAPFILIQTHNLRIQSDTVTLGVRAIFGVYASGNYSADEPTLILPDNKAYIDLMLIMQRAVEAITTHQTFGNAQIAAGAEVNVDIYDLDAPTWPFTYGYITFDVQYRASGITTELNL